MRFIERYRIIILSVLLVSTQLFAQSVNVSGKIISFRYAVKNAMVTFIDNSDTTKKYSAVTDNTGAYELSVLVTSTGANQTRVRSFSLDQNYPNPFSFSTAISYKLKTHTDARVTVYDILGREIKRFDLGQQNTGSHSLVWDGLNNFGEKISPGIYFYRLQAGNESQVRKMIFNSGLNNVEVSVPQSLSRINAGPDAALVDLKVNDFTVRVENTENTLPHILTEQLDNVSFRNDTTINISVDHLPTASVDFDMKRQTIRGFGASNILLWRPDMTESEIETAFGTGEGQLGFSILRIMLEADKNRWSLYIPTAKKVLEMGALIIAAPWYAPSEMVETVNNIDRVRYDAYEAYAAHLDSFVTFMNNNDVPIYGVSIQNEPDITDQWTSWTSQEMFNFMKNNAHTISAANVMAPESFHLSRDYSDPILNDSVAAANTDIVCGHIYGGGIANYSLAEEKGKEVWMTEYLINSGNPPSDISLDTGWNGAMETAESISNCMNVGMSAYVWWYIVRYYGPIADGTYANKGDVTKKGYVMSHFSRFVRPGDRRVESDTFPPTAGIKISAYKDSLSSKEVIIAINPGSSEKVVAVNLYNNSKNTFTPYSTTEFKNVEQGLDLVLDSNKILITLEASSITTFIAD